MRELQKVPHPFPLVTKFTYTGELNIKFSREIFLPAKQEIQTYVEDLIKDKWLQLKLTSKDNFKQIIGKSYFEKAYFNETSSPRILKSSFDGKDKLS